MTKELLVYAPASAKMISILVPKRRGKGFAMVPLGHNVCPLSSLAYDIGFDLWGLDGSLDVQTGYLPHDDDLRAALVERVMAPLSNHYKMVWRSVGKDEFFANHPIELTGSPPDPA